MTARMPFPTRSGINELLKISLYAGRLSLVSEVEIGMPPS